MKRLLLHYSVFHLGGAEMSTLRMIKALADRGWSITLVITTGGGTAEHMIDPRARVVRLRPGVEGEQFTSAKTLPQRIVALPDLLLYAIYRTIGGLRMQLFRFQHFDAAAVLLMGMPSNFVRRFVRASVKAIWIRNDLAQADPKGQVAARLNAAAPEIDHFVCVSETARASLVAVCPEAQHKASVVYNLLDPAEMRNRATLAPAPFPDDLLGGVVKVLSVCRLSEKSKALLRLVRVCRRLVDTGLNLHWYIVGDGPDRAMFREAIDAAGLSGHITLLGRLDNPFPAYAAADLVAMLSNYEGLCGVVNEARVLERPVIATQVSGIAEQLTDGVNGVIVEQDEDAIVAAMTRLLKDPTLRSRLATGGYPEVLLNDETKLDQLEALFMRAETPAT